MENRMVRTINKEWVKALDEYLSKFNSDKQVYLICKNRTLRFTKLIVELFPNIAAPNSCPFEDELIQLYWSNEKCSLSIDILPVGDIEVYYSEQAPAPKYSKNIWYEEFMFENEIPDEVKEHLSKFIIKEI